MPGDMQTSVQQDPWLYSQALNPRPADTSPPPAPVSTNGLPADIELGRNAFLDDAGRVHYYVQDPVTGQNTDELVFAQQPDGNYALYNKPSAAGGGADNTVGMANVGLGYANLAEDQRQFDASLAQKQADSAQQNDQFNKDFNEGQRQFDLKFSRSAYESDRDYEQAKQQFAQSFAETQRQFDLQYGLDTRTADREDKRLALDDRLGTGRLALDTELGRGALANDTTRARNDTARVGIERDRLGLDTELGRGRLALDTRLGEGGLRLNAADLAFRQRSDDRSQTREDNKFRAEVLRNPSDYVFRAFQSRGAQAPTDRITQADILNTIGTHAAGGTANEPYFLAGGGGPELIANHGDGTFSVASAPQTQRILSRSPEGAAALNSEVMGGAQQWNGTTPGGWQRLHQYMNDPRWAEWAATMGRGPWRMGAEGAMPESRPSVMPVEGSRMGPLTMQPVPAAQPATAQPVVNWMGNRPMEAAPTPRMGLTGYSSGTDDAFFQELDRLSSYTPAAAPTYTQDQIVNAARTYSPPAVSAALAGQDEGTYRPATSGLTLRRFGRLTPGEQAALSTRLGVEFNTSLQDELSGLQSRFGNVRSTPMARMAA